MYSYDDRMKAVQLFINYDHQVSRVIQVSSLRAPWITACSNTRGVMALDGEIDTMVPHQTDRCSGTHSRETARMSATLRQPDMFWHRRSIGQKARGSRVDTSRPQTSLSCGDLGNG